MRTAFAILTLLLWAAESRAQQDFQQGALQWQHDYKAAFLTDEHSPLKATDTGYVRFYKPDRAYTVQATITKPATPDTIWMQTHSDDVRAFRVYAVYAVALFRLRGKPFRLHIYESVPATAGGTTHLFIPFNDLTNYETTYGGGRYIDVEKADIRNGKMLLDFNKAYNPYCAFAEGYSCPIPPVENKLNARIEAGEQLFGKAVE